MEQTKKRLDYKWVIVGLCFLMVFTNLGFCSSNKSLYLSAITEALGIKRSVFSIADSCRFVTTAIINLFFGSFRKIVFIHVSFSVPCPLVKNKACKGQKITGCTHNS